MMLVSGSVDKGSVQGGLKLSMSSWATNSCRAAETCIRT